MLLGFVYKCFNYFSFSNTMSTHFQDNIKNILMLKILKWNHLLLYLKSRLWNCICFKKPIVKEKLINAVVCCWLKWKDVKKNVKKKLGEWELFRIVLFFIWVSRIIPALGYASVLFAACFYLSLVESSHWEVFTK